MLKIQEFLRNGGTLTDLRQKYEIGSEVDNNLGVVVFNYRVFAPLSNPIVQESRGLVLEKNTWNVVCKSIQAFYEPKMLESRPTLKAFDWNSAKAQEKLDGALLCLYFYQNEWRVSTRFSATGSWLVWSINSKPNKINWVDYVKMTLQDMGTSWDEFTSKLNKDIFYTFEIVGPENRVIVIYPDRKLYLVAAVRRDTLEEIDIYSLNFPELKVPYKEVKSIDEAWKIVFDEEEPYDHEGRILIDKNFNRLKLRNPAYVDLMQSYSADDQHKALKQIKYNITIEATSCHPFEQEIETTKGIKTFAQLKVGDQVYGRGRSVQTVSHIYRNLKQHSIYRIKTKHPSGVTNTLKCTDSHPLHLYERITLPAACLSKNSLVFGDTQRLKVLSIKQVGQEPVVGITVEPDHEYICGGLLNHNMADQLSKFSVGASVFSQFASMARFMHNHYQSTKNTKPDAQIASIWPKAFQKMSEGMAMSDVLDSSSNDEIIEALRKYNDYNEQNKEGKQV